MKKAIVLLLTGIVLTAILSQTVFARNLDDHYSDDYDIPDFDNSYEYYYDKGLMDETGTIQMSGGSVSMHVGEARDLSVDRIYHSHDEDLQISIVGRKIWESKKPEIASVDNNGVVTAHKTGSTRITVTYHDNRAYKITQTIRLTVNSAGTVAGSSIAQSFEITEGKRICLAGLLPKGSGTVSWATSNEQIAEVDTNGFVTAGSIGKCTVTASYTDADDKERKLDFSIRVTSMLLDNRSRSITISISQGESIDIVGLFYPNILGSSSALSNIRCATGDASVASLDGYIIHGRQKGSCYITISEYDGYEVSRSQRIKVLVS